MATILIRTVRQNENTMKVVAIILLFLCFCKLGLSQSNVKYNTYKSWIDWRTIYDSTSTMHKVDSTYEIHITEWDFHHLTDSTTIEIADSIVHSYFTLFKMNSSKRTYYTYLNKKLLQIIKINSDNSYDYQEFVNELNKYHLTYSPSKGSGFTINDEFEMEIKTIYKDSLGVITEWWSR